MENNNRIGDVNNDSDIETDGPLFKVSIIDLLNMSMFRRRLCFVGARNFLLFTSPRKQSGKYVWIDWDDF